MLLNRIPKASAVNTPEDERSDSDYLIDLRHYSISTKPLGLSKPLTRLNAAEKIISSSPSTAAGGRAKGGKGSVPNLGKLEDISEYMLDPSLAASGYTSESEIDGDAEIEVLPGSTKNPTKQKRTTSTAGGAEKRAVRLTEIGPRMTLELVKIEEGLSDGKVLYHSFVKKTRKEEKELEERWRERKKVREERRKVQEENVRRKKEESEAKRGKRGKKGLKEEGGEGGGGEGVVVEEEESDEDEIIDYAKSEDEEDVGSSRSGSNEEDGEGSDSTGGVEWDNEDESEMDEEEG